MLQAVPEAVAARARRVTDGEGNDFILSPFFGRTADPEAGPPSAFQLEPQGRVVISPHFHTVDQFQLVVSGSGSFGRHDFTAPCLVFTDAFTTYGPIRFDEDGDAPAFFTLRIEHGNGQQLYMPKFKELKTHRSGRSRIVLNGRASVDAVGEGGSVELLSEPDGAAAWIVRVGAGQAVASPSGATGRGQYWVALDGAMTAEDGTDTPVVFVPPGESGEAGAVYGGAQGAAVLIMQFPIAMAMN